jgi:hypothetical protein
MQGWDEVDVSYSTRRAGHDGGVQVHHKNVLSLVYIDVIAATITNLRLQSLLDPVLEWTGYLAASYTVQTSLSSPAAPRSAGTQNKSQFGEEAELFPGPAHPSGGETVRVGVKVEK